MPTPYQVFEHPDKYWSFITAAHDSDFEDQYFDRKEVGRVEVHGHVSKSQLHEIREEIAGCISAFANANPDGGLLILGISKTGEVKGTKHLTDDQRLSLANINALLINQAAKIQSYECVNAALAPDQIYLIYVPYALHGICETPGQSPKAWMRQGAQNVPLSYTQRSQLMREKRLVDFEMEFCCPYDPDDLDRGILSEFRHVFLLDATYTYTDEQLLYQAGALIKEASGYAFTNAGALFFAANPQRVLPSSYVRLLRFNVAVDLLVARGLPTFEKSFTGPITKQIRDVRTFFQETGFFKTYQRRNPAGGFINEPEYPFIAIDEAIVNAVAHRDYAIKLPIECESYKDAFIVRNPGRVMQRDHTVPAQFSLDKTVLVSTPRNSKLIEWLKLMRDARGGSFVQAISEGTKRMRDEMANMHLPPPAYDVSESQTTLQLISNAEEREAQIQAALNLPTTEFTNLFPLRFAMENGRDLDRGYIADQYRAVMVALENALINHGWYIDNSKYSKLVAHHRGSDITSPQGVSNIVRFYPAYVFQIRSYWGNYYLCIDYSLEVKSVPNLRKLLGNLPASDLIDKSAIAQLSGWHHGRIRSADREFALIYFPDSDQEVQIASDRVIPRLPREMIERMLSTTGIRFDLPRAIKQHSLALDSSAARQRAEKTQAAVQEIAQSCFPLRVSGMIVTLSTKPVSLSSNGRSREILEVQSLPEPSAEFNRHQETRNIREGITRFGSYDLSSQAIEIVPICAPELQDQMSVLIGHLKAGTFKYLGSERTFKTRFTYNSIITARTPEATLQTCERLLAEHPEWGGNEQLNRIFLVHTPEQGYSSDDENAPYYRIKRLLLERGIPSQMIDTPTLLDPKMKDLNIALNIVAKCGITPWVLPDAIPDADFFVGLSYTQNSRRNSPRLMGYANVFNQYGRWEFYSGNTETFDYAERVTYLRLLVQQTLSRITLSETPNIYFHYSAKFSRDDRQAILEAARSVRPMGTYSFVSINTGHNVRLYDSRAETDGSLSRGSYVVASTRQIYLSTTGFNPFRRTLGTPEMLELTIWTEPPVGVSVGPPDLRSLAVQVLSLTKLNWASTDSLCAEPITIKYAGDIAYLTSAFLRQDQNFRLHPTLERTPWFI